jgi:arabinogalactan oligomer/maltooligosaccharide transport system permease protein
MESGYQADYAQYFGKYLSAKTEALNAELSTKTGHEVVLSFPLVKQGNAAAVLDGVEGPQVFYRADLSAKAEDARGFIVPHGVVQALLTPLDQADSPAEVNGANIAKAAELVGAIQTAVRDGIKEQIGRDLAPGALEAKNYESGLPELPGKTLVRVSYSVTVDGTDYGMIVSYYTNDSIKALVGDNFRGDEKTYSLRDYGGYISSSLYNLVTLGSLVIGDSYRGGVVEAYNAEQPWMSADNSSLLLARGLIVMVILVILVFFWVVNIIDAYRGRLHRIRGEHESFAQFTKRIWDTMYVYILIAPAAVLILFFTLVPFLYTFLCGFTDWTYRVYLLQQLVHWTGFEQYGIVFTETAWFTVFLQVFGWTAIWALLTSFTVYFMGFANALIVESPLVRGKKFWRTIMIVPWALPAMVSLLAFKNAFDKDGLINQILLSTGLMKPVSDLLFNIGLEGRPDNIIFWFDATYNGNLAKAVCIAVNMWLGTPYFMMLIIGVISTISADLYEAAQIDGASGFKRFRHITLPVVLNSTIPAMIMTVTFNFNNFGGIYFLTVGKPDWVLEKLPDALRTWSNSMPAQTDILISWIYKISFNPLAQLYNKASVFTVFIFLILGLFSVVNMKMTKVFNDEGEE